MGHSLGAQFIMVGKARWQELEVAGDIVSTLRKKRAMNVYAQLLSPFYVVWDSRYGVVLPLVRAGSCPSINLIKVNSHRPARMPPRSR